MEVNKVLINNFFNNTCSAAEAAAVAKYFSANKEALEKYLNKAEWDTIYVEGNFDAAVSNKILESIKQQLFTRPETKIAIFKKIRLNHFVAAASIILAIAGIWLYQYHSNAAKNNIVSIRNKDIKHAAKDTVNNIPWQVKSNSHKNSIVVKLQDGSVVTLFKGAVIKYPQPFAESTREIILSGDAFFEVAKNKQKPFIVYSGNLSTTALGTSFRITAYKEGKVKINIKLFTGKVVIKSIKKIPGWKKDVILLPNEELTYNNQTESTVVSSCNRNAGSIVKIPNASVNKTSNNGELKFNNTSLPEVMNELSELYNIKISYINSDIEKMNFTGVINKADDLQAILKVIAQMNSLEMGRVKDGFSINKPK